MKAHRQHHPNRPADKKPESEPMASEYNPPYGFQEDASSAPDAPTENMHQALEIDVGKAMPTTSADHMPLLQTSSGSEAPIELPEGSPLRSMLAEGMHFVGNAQLSGPCSVAGQVDGNLTQAAGAVVAVVVTETGRVKGDITARKISVMGHTDGILDSGEGEVALHDTASVHGLVRYGRIQVNGADLNATLERVNLKKTGV
ncbi:MAG: polymer-forming cytoskeletal protein [Hydrogenophaga sp.]